MDIIISGSSDRPIYRQIFDQISAQIIKGELPSGQALPPIRTVAKELHISVITIKKAWEELERSGFIYTMVGRGCFVADLNKAGLADKKNALLDDKMAKDVAYYKALGIGLDEAISSLTKHYQKY